MRRLSRLPTRSPTPEASRPPPLTRPGSATIPWPIGRRIVAGLIGGEGRGADGVTARKTARAAGILG